MENVDLRTPFAELNWSCPRAMTSLYNLLLSKKLRRNLI